MLNVLTPVTQRADYTFKYNRSLGRHGWLRLTPAYSVKLVKGLLEGLRRDVRVLDPFSGTATTGLVAAEQGNSATTFDINPFLIWLGNTKCRNYSRRDIDNIKEKVEVALGRIEGLLETPNWTPPIFNIERWWAPHTLKVLAAFRKSLVEQFGEPAKSGANGIVWVAFCRVMIETSSAKFNHVSMSLSKSAAHYEAEHVATLYRSVIGCILESCELALPGNVNILPVDARSIPKLKQRFDVVITSPPYPNRISYIRELRPYMYWTGFLDHAREAGELDWKAIGGTWGVATSRLVDWQPADKELPPSLRKIVKSIAESDSKNGELLASYVFKYFHDMHLHLASLRNVLAREAEIHYIVGNSSFYGNMVDTPLLLSESLRILGYKNIRTEIIRKRNCNKALFEYNVSARS